MKPKVQTVETNTILSKLKYNSCVKMCNGAFKVLSSEKYLISFLSLGKDTPSHFSLKWVIMFLTNKSYGNRDDFQIYYGFI